MELECELYCDSSAALGITQRAGIGKVRHLRTQGLWVQEVRMSGRISYKKVLGTKNPADLLTKHMTAELSGRHLECLNMRLGGGRAESAPTLNSLESYVQMWYEDDAIDSVGVEPRRVRFSNEVQVRPIPASGRGRRTPVRGVAANILRNKPIIENKPDAEYDCDCEDASVVERGDGKKWADVDVDSMCMKCTESLCHLSRWRASSDRAIDSLGVSGFTGATTTEQRVGEPSSPVAAAHNGQSAAHNCRSVAGTRRVPIVATLRAVAPSFDFHVDPYQLPERRLRVALATQEERSSVRDKQRETHVLLTRVAAQASLLDGIV